MALALALAACALAPAGAAAGAAAGAGAEPEAGSGTGPQAASAQLAEKIPPRQAGGELPATESGAEPEESGAPAAGGGQAPEETALAVGEVWLDGGTLHVAVAGAAGGGSQTFELNLGDYAKAGDESVTVQAADSRGNKSNAVQFRNPYYAPPEAAGAGGGEGAAPEGGEPAESQEPGEPGEPGGAHPFTPGGQGEVLDNAAEGDGKEFFTVETADGNIFYLIVDRQRGEDNVYLLNAVTEGDLASLAKPGGGEPASAEGAGGAAAPSAAAAETPAPTPEPAPEPASEPAPEPEPEPASAPAKGGGAGAIALAAAALIAAGGAGYYFKIVRPKRPGACGEDESEGEEEAEGAEGYGEDDGPGADGGEKEGYGE
jgi:hypothetical protein